MNTAKKNTETLNAIERDIASVQREIRKLAKRIASATGEEMEELTTCKRDAEKRRAGHLRGYMAARP